MAKAMKQRPSVEEIHTCIQISTYSIYSEVSTSTTASIFALGNALNAKKIKHLFNFTNEFDLSHNLDRVANSVFKDKRITHLFLVDPDLQFPADLVVEMLALDDPIVSVKTPERSLDLRELHSEVQRFGYNPASCETPALREFDGDRSEPKLSFALIHRRVLDRMVEKSIAPKFLDVEGFDENDRFRPPPEIIHGFFSPIYDDQTRDQLQSHGAFCYRWRALCNGKIRLFESDSITRRGLFPFTTRFRDLKAD